MLNKVLSYFTPNRHNTAKNLVNISYKADTEFLPEEFRILERRRGGLPAGLRAVLGGTVRH